jgi:apolipoprotein N-acyltransferase
MLHRYRMQTAFGISQASMRGGGQYLTIVGVLIESAFVYAGVCTVFVILLHKNSPATGWWNGIVTAASVRVFALHANYEYLTLRSVSLPVMDHSSHRSWNRRQFNNNRGSIQADYTAYFIHRSSAQH